MRVLLFLSLVSLASALWGVIGREQSIAVQGRLICNGMPAGDVKLKLYDKEVTFDVKMDEGYTNNNGEFRLQGSRVEITDIDPKLNVYHKCNYNGLCYQKFGITIPDQYISYGSQPQRIYDIGTINLMNKFSGQSIDCLN